MEKHRATKQLRFEKEHRLPSHTGACRVIHGHSYLVEVTAEAESQLNENGMVVDFKYLKELCEEIFGSWDHALMLYREDPFVQIFYDIANKNNLPVHLIIVDYEPTAENMCIELYRQLNDEISETWISPGFTISKVVVWETATSYAECGK